MSVRSVFLASCASVCLPLAARAAVLPPQHEMPGAVQAGAASFDPEVEGELEVMRARTGHLLVRPALNGCVAVPCRGAPYDLVNGDCLLLGTKAVVRFGT